MTRTALAILAVISMVVAVALAFPVKAETIEDFAKVPTSFFGAWGVSLSVLV
jgi:hypothetical protein